MMQTEDFSKNISLFSGSYRGIDVKELSPDKKTLTLGTKNGFGNKNHYIFSWENGEDTYQSIFFQYKDADTVFHISQNHSQTNAIENVDLVDIFTGVKVKITFKNPLSDDDIFSLFTAGEKEKVSFHDCENNIIAEKDIALNPFHAYSAIILDSEQKYLDIMMQKEPFLFHSILHNVSTPDEKSISIPISEKNCTVFHPSL